VRDIRRQWWAGRPGAFTRAAQWAAAITVIVLAGALTPFMLPARSAVAAAPGCSTPVVHPAGPFTVQSDHRTINDHNGNTFISDGTTVPGLSSPTFSAGPANFVTTVVNEKDIPKIDATADAWCGNTVRLQVSQYNVTPDGGTCDTGFLDQALAPEVREAEAKGQYLQLKLTAV
jgi:hypothetical protein